MTSSRRRLAGLVVLAFITGCASGPPAPIAVLQPSAATGNWLAGLNGTSVGDVIQRPALRLLDTNSQTFALRARPQDEVTMLFFGYTHCPDVCPTTMADLASALRLLPAAQRHRVAVVFVTEDPSRDQPPQLRAWLDQFDPDFIGLSGGGDRTAKTLQVLKAASTRLRVSGDVDHTGNVYAFAGKNVVVYTGGTTPRMYAADLQLLLAHTA